MKRKLLLAALCVVGALGLQQVRATDYLTDFSGYTVTKTAVSNDNTSGTVREFWRGGVLGFDVNGTSTTLPNGVYSFSVQAVYRGHLTKDIPTGIIAYAESDGAQYMAPICNYTDGTVASASLTAFATAFETVDNYLNTIPYIIVTDGKIKVGVKSMSTQPYCDNGFWFIFNTASFKVSDVTDASVLATALADVKAQAEGLLASNDADNSTARSELQSAHDAATATAADIVNVKQKIDAYLAFLVDQSTLDSPKDVSFYFTNPKYSIRNLDLVGGLVTSGNSGSLGQPFGWTCFDAGGTGDNGSGNQFQANQGYNWFTTIANTTSLDGQAANYDAEKTGGYSIYQRISWNQWAEQTHSAKQTVTLPAGKYKISVPAYASAKNDDYKGYVIFNVGGTEDSKEVTSGSWNEYEKEFTLTETTDVSVDMQFNKLRRAQNVGKQYAYFDGVTLLSYGDPVKAKKAELEALQATITDEAYFTNTDYTNVVGTEKTNLTVAKTLTATAETVEAYETAITSVQNAINAFTAAKTNYDALVAEIAKAKALGIATATADGYAATNSSTAATALTNTQNLKVAEYTFITPTYTESATLGTWTETFAEDLNGEGYVANGPTYFNEWGSATRTAKQTITLPAGDYAVSCIGRGAVGTSGYLYYKIGDAEAVTTDFNMKGNRGRGVDTDGAANFSDNGTYTCNNEGFGWEYRFLTFTLSEETAVEIGVSATFANNWVSIYAPQLRTTEASVKALRLIEISTAIGNVPTDKMNATVQSTLNTKKVAAQGASDSNTLGELNTILSELNAAIEAANTSIAAYASVKAAIDEAEAVSLTGSTLDLSTYEDAYDNGSMLDEEADATVAAIKVALKTALFSQTLIADVTALMTNPSFENGTTGWNEQHSATNNTVSWNSEASEAAPDGNKILNMTTSNGYFTGFAIDQPVTLPAGYYRLTANVKSTNVDVDTYIFASTNTHWSGKGMATIGTAKVETANTWESLATEFYVDAEKTIYLGVTTESGNWSGATYANYQADNFKLYYMGNAITKTAEPEFEGYKTFYNNTNVNYKAPEGTKVYIAAEPNKGYVNLTEAGNIVPAGEAVILKTTIENDADTDIMLTPTAESVNPSDFTANKLQAAADNTVSNVYILAYTNALGYGFYYFTGTLDAGDVYLTGDAPAAGAPVRMVIVADGEATAINSVKAEAGKATDAIYNMAGQRVDASYKGIVIKNGKKYMIK